MPKGQAGDGEVEDYALYIGQDFGEPPTFRTAHWPEVTVRVTWSATCDWGLSWIRSRTVSLARGQWATVPTKTASCSSSHSWRAIRLRFLVTSSAGGGTLDYFFDFDGAGGFGNVANEVFTAELTGGTQMLSVSVPASAVAGGTYARFRLSSAGELGPTGPAADGEVED